MPSGKFLHFRENYYKSFIPIILYTFLPIFFTHLVKRIVSSSSHHVQSYLVPRISACSSTLSSHLYNTIFTFSIKKCVKKFAQILLTIQFSRDVQSSKGLELLDRFPQVDKGGGRTNLFGSRV